MYFYYLLNCETSCGEVESNISNFNTVKVVLLLNKIYIFFCLPQQDMKILEGILFTNASWHSRINLPHGYIKRSQEANRLLCINCQSNWYLFFPQKKVSSTNCHYNKLLPYPSSIWTPQGFPLWNYRMEFLSKVTI